MAGVLSVSNRPASAHVSAAEPLALSRVAHLGLVVRDADVVARRWAEAFGVRRSPARSEGTDRRVTEIYFDNLTVEVSQPSGGASIWRDFLNRHGEGIHHVAFEVPRMDDAVAALETRGGRRVMGVSGPSVFIDFDAEMGGGIELLPASQAAPEARAGADPGTTVAALGHLTSAIEPARLFWRGVLGTDVPAARDTRGVPFPADCGCDREAYIREVNIRTLTPGLNLIQPVGGVSVWRRLIERHEGLAYLQFNLPDQAALDARIARLLELGGVRTLGDAGAPYAYVDMQRQLGMTLLLVKTTPAR